MALVRYQLGTSGFRFSAVCFDWCPVFLASRQGAWTQSPGGFAFFENVSYSNVPLLPPFLWKISRPRDGTWGCLRPTGMLAISVRLVKSEPPTGLHVPSTPRTPRFHSWFWEAPSHLLLQPRACLVAATRPAFHSVTEPTGRGGGWGVFRNLFRIKVVPIGHLSFMFTL